MIQQVEHTVEEIVVEFTTFVKEVDAEIEMHVQHWLDEIEEVYSEDNRE